MDRYIIKWGKGGFKQSNSHPLEICKELLPYYQEQLKHLQCRIVQVK